METRIDKFPVRTDIIRTPASGPKPANTLVFLQCRASGADIGIYNTDLVQFEVQFKSQFKIDGYLQARHDWYLANTLVSATGMLRVVSTTTDFEFLVALDSVEPALDLDGVLGFTCRFGMQIDGLGLFEGRPELEMTCNICAYALVYEPQPDLPPSGRLGQRWRFDPRHTEAAFSHVGQAGHATGERSTLRLTLPARRDEGDLR